MKRTLAILLSLVMLLGVLPLTAFAEEVDTVETGAPGSSEDNPLYVANFADLKEALESNNTLYIQIYSFNNSPGYSFYDLVPGVDYNNNAAAITQRGTKYLKLLTKVDCRARSVDTPLYCFIDCIGNLNISGTGQLCVSFNAWCSNSIVFVQNPGKLTVDGDVTLDARLKSVDAFGRAVDNHSGKVTLNGGKYFGCESQSNFYNNDAGAIHIYGPNCETVINGGEYQAVNGVKNYGILNMSDNTVLNGGTFHGIYNDSNKTSKTLFEILGEHSCYRDVETGQDFDGSAVQETEQTLEVCSTLAIVYFNPNGGSGTMEPVKVEKGSSYTLPECTFTPPEGKVFDMWREGLFTNYAPGESFTVDDDTAIRAIWKNASSSGLSISGKVTSYLDSSEITTISLSKKKNDEYQYVGIRTVKGDVASISGVDYRFNGLTMGQYQLTVSKKNHVTRQYDVTILLNNITQDVKINPIGDADGNGKVNAADAKAAFQHSNEQKLITDEYKFKCADVASPNNRVNSADAKAIFQHANEQKSLWTE